MSTNEQTPLSQPTSAVRNTLGKEQISQDMDMPASDASLREYCDRNYHQLLPIIAKKVHQEKVQQEKLKALKAHLNFEEVLQHSESGTPRGRRDLRKRLGSRRIRSMFGSPERRRSRPESPRKRDPKIKMVFKRLEKDVFHRLGDKGKTPAQEEHSLLLRNIITKEHPHTGWKLCHKAKVAQEDTGSQGQKSKGQALRMMIYPSHGVWFDDLPPESVDSYDDLKEAFLANFCQQKKCFKDPVEIHHMKQREGESTEDFVLRFKVESRDVKGAPKNHENLKIHAWNHKP
ncbi:reverse transcriptase domain-containing protein [Tanacetum coccineum]